jgi:succinate dehydrogenase/fumarate reductase flavoprotein subunit
VFHTTLAPPDAASEKLRRTLDEAPAGAASGDGAADVSERDVREWMWQSVGLLRDGDRLSSTLRDLDRATVGVLAGRRFEDPGRSRLASLTIVGRLMARAALRRLESRGGHYRFDFPVRDDEHWRCRIAEAID